MSVLQGVAVVAEGHALWVGARLASRCCRVGAGGGMHWQALA